MALECTKNNTLRPMAQKRLCTSDLFVVVVVVLVVVVVVVVVVVLTQTTGLLNHLKPLLCYVI